MKKIIACIGTFFALVTLSTQAKNPYLLQTADRSAMEHWVDSVFETLSPKERIAQLLVITVRNSDTPQNRKTLQRLIQEQKIGGLLFDSGTAKDQANLTNYCQSLSKVPLMVTLDGEWGLAMRLSDTPRFPVNMMLGAVQNDSLLYEYGRAVGKQCKRMGIHVNFAPVLDINSNPRNPVIGKRSFGESLKNVSSKAIAYAKGLESVGVMAVAKHFPGHGDTSEDSHKTLPLVPHSKEYRQRAIGHNGGASEYSCMGCHQYPLFLIADYHPRTFMRLLKFRGVNIHRCFKNEGSIEIRQYGTTSHTRRERHRSEPIETRRTAEQHFIGYRARRNNSTGHR